jgi:hypothetical protein
MELTTSVAEQIQAEHAALMDQCGLSSYEQLENAIEYIKSQLSGIDAADLTKAEYNILKRISKI